jgi:hypothetical protein
MSVLSTCLKSVIVSVTLVLISIKAISQAPSTDSAEKKKLEAVSSVSKPAENKPAVAPANKPDLKVLDVYKEGHSDINDKDRHKAGIGDIIVVRVSNLEALLNKAKCKTIKGEDSSANCTQQEIRLFINGRIIKNINPISGAPQIDSSGKYGELQYRLERNTDNDDAWTDLLGSPKIGGGKFFIHPVTISVGLENGYAITASPQNFSLVRIKKTWFWICFICLGIYLYFIVRLARHRGLLRDRSINLSVLQIVTNNSKLPYSLARFQMAFWFTLIISSFMFIWLITGSYDIITSSILALIGISVGTSLSAAVIDNSKAEEILQKTVDLKAEKDKLDKDIIDLQQLIGANPPPAGIAQLNVDLNLKQARLSQITPEITKNTQILTPRVSEGFLNDILSDSNGISFHRLQMFVWTLILGLIFVFSVWVRLSMPEFSTTLLALQGLTAGTYLGFKIPEKQT